MVQAFLTGIHPRSERLVEATRRYDRGLTTNEELQDVLRDDILQLVRSQEDADFTYITDGLLNWQDLLRLIASRIEGISEGPLTRWYDNNNFYRKPIIIGEMTWKPDEERPLIHTSLLPPTKRWKAILPGPYTFATLSDNKHYSDNIQVLDHYADALKEEIRELEEIGVSQIQLNEASMVTQRPSKDLMEKTKETTSAIGKASNASIMIHTLFGSIEGILPDLLDFDVDIIGIDFYQTDLESISDIDITKKIACGCIDSRNSIVEDRCQIAEFVRQVRNKLNPPEICLCPNCDLEFLPRIKADEKLAELGQACRLLEEEN